ncbi:MAG: helix-turn-helix domain-containing protein [Myxococcota bacterium]
MLKAARWPGNIRELRNTLERAAILADGPTIGTSEIRLDEVRPSTPEGSLVDMEKRAIAAALEASGGNRKRAAARLGIGVRTLYEKLKRYGLS